MLGWTRSIGGAPFRLIWSAAVLRPAGRGRSGAVIGSGIPVGIVGVGCARRERDEQAHGEILHVRHPTTSSAPQPNCTTQASRLIAVTKSRQAVSWVTASRAHGRHSDPSGVGNVACPNQSRLIPVALSGHRLGPVASGERGDPVGHSHELVPAVTTCVDDRLVAVPDAVAEIIAAHEFPDVFHRI